MPNYVKFMRGTINAYNKLATKDDDTLYFLYDNDNPSENEGYLYLGNKFISGPCGGDVQPEVINLTDLKDVIISQDLNYDALLAFDPQTQQWKSYSFDALNFGGASKNFAGLSGLVPAPKAGEQNLFLKADGTWAEANTTKSLIFEVETKINETHQSAIIRAIGDNLISSGDIVIVKDFICNNNTSDQPIYQYTSYVYNNSKWVAMDSNYNAEDIYFKNNLIFTKPDETIKAIEDGDVIELEGKNIKEAIETILTLSTVDKPIKIDSNIFKYVDGELSFIDFSEAPEGAQLVKDSSGKISWIKPDTTTIEGLSVAVETLQSGLENTYTKLETNNKISEAIAQGPRLKRKIVNNIDNIDINAADADQYIYMVPTGLNDDNKYSEYIIIEEKIVNSEGIETIAKKLESVGDWEVNLSNYASISDLDKKVDAEPGKVLISQKEVERLATIDENYIKSVDSKNFAVSTEGKLSIVEIEQSQVKQLDQVLKSKVEAVPGKGLSTNDFTTAYKNQLDTLPNTEEFKLLKSTVGNLNQTINGYVDDEGTEVLGLKSTVSLLQQQVGSLNNNYISINDFETIIGEDINTLLDNKYNIIEKIDDIEERLTWGEIPVII